jgi:hypothetical protein
MGKTTVRLMGTLLVLALMAGASAAAPAMGEGVPGEGQEPPPAGTVTVGLDPSSVAVTPGKIFLIDIRVDARSQEVNGAEVHLDFDPDYLSVVDETGEPASEIIRGVALPDQIENSVDNSLGEIHYAAGKVSPGSLQIPFVLATIRFRAEELVTNTEVTFRVEGDRRTKVTMDFTLVPIHEVTDAAVRVFVYRFYLPLAMNECR